MCSMLFKLPTTWNNTFFTNVKKTNLSQEKSSVNTQSWPICRQIFLLPEFAHTPPLYPIRYRITLMNPEIGDWIFLMLRSKLSLTETRASAVGLWWSLILEILLDRLIGLYRYILYIILLELKSNQWLFLGSNWGRSKRNRRFL